jgi:hypothetical protein
MEEKVAPHLSSWDVPGLPGEALFWLIHQQWPDIEDSVK